MPCAIRGGGWNVEKILLAVDESDHSARAAELAGKLATLSNSEIVVLHVHEILPTRGGPVDIRVIESDVADDIATRLKDQGVTAHSKKSTLIMASPRIRS